jgi:hypothetical protein
MRLFLCALAFVIQLWPLNACAHPLPDTVIDINQKNQRIDLDITLPLADLLLALPKHPKTVDDLKDTDNKMMRDYFISHMALLSKSGTVQKMTVEEMKLDTAHDEEVGTYQVLKVNVWVVPDIGFDAKDFALWYDVIIHQVPNHAAILKSATKDIGVFHYDFVKKKVEPIDVQLMDAH